jgi:transcriptional regulator with XRE-family HTH domain
VKAIETTPRHSRSDADEKFPTRLRWLRVSQGYSQRELAALTGNAVGERTLSHWENGRTTPYLGAQLRAIAYALRVTPGFLLRGEEGERFGNR